MPTANVILTRLNDEAGRLFEWTLTSENPDGTPIEWAQWADRCFSASGTWGGATLTIRGSNDGITWMTLSNAAGGTGATFTGDGLKSIIELPRYVRPELTAPGTGASVNVTLMARRP